MGTQKKGKGEKRHRYDRFFKGNDGCHKKERKGRKVFQINTGGHVKAEKGERTNKERN